MKNFSNLIICLSVAAFTVSLGTIVFTPFLFLNRVEPGIYLAGELFTGITAADLPTYLAQVERALQAKEVSISLKDMVIKTTLSDLGVALNTSVTGDKIMAVRQVLPWRITVIDPVLTFDRVRLNQLISAQFAPLVRAPISAGLSITAANEISITPSSSGEGVDLISLERDIVNWLGQDDKSTSIQLVIVSTGPNINENQVEATRVYVAQLLREGFRLSGADQELSIPPVIIQRLLIFTETRDQMTDTYVLTAQFEASRLKDYITATVLPVIDQQPQDARFERAADKVVVFQVARQGRQVDINKTIVGLQSAIANQQTSAALSVQVVEPAVGDLEDITQLGITSLLASGVSDFTGSPANRVHNIKIGVARYHGLLIPSGEEFSFNQHLGPVTGAFGWKPELVIKNNVTIPEFGGGICQVSTTAFRAAVQAGLAITQRKNHSYAVRYYGEPGFDATIYPGYTDLRFINNTPGYILIQAHIEGTKVVFDFWGTDDGREVKVAGPVQYDRQSNGAVKATLSRVVTKNGEVFSDDTFYSSYKSPKLFPKVVAIDDPKGV